MKYKHIAYHDNSNKKACLYILRDQYRMSHHHNYNSKMNHHATSLQKQKYQIYSTQFSVKINMRKRSYYQSYTHTSQDRKSRRVLTLR